MTGWCASGAADGAISAAAALAAAPSAAGAAACARGAAAAVSGAGRASGAADDVFCASAAPAAALSAAPSGTLSASSAAALAVDDTEIAGLLAGMRLGPSDEKVTYAEACHYGGGDAAQVAVAAKLDLLSDLERETLWANLAPGWRDFLKPWPPGADRDMGALARLDPLHGGWPTLEELGFRSMRHDIALAMASESAFEANASRRRTRRGGQGRTRVQRPGGGSWLPKIYLGLADRNPAAPLPTGAPYPIQSTCIIIDNIMSGAPYGSSTSPRYTAASTEGVGDDAGAVDEEEGPAEEWDLSGPGGSDSSSEGGEGLEPLG